ncbi:hypothetical protein H6F32_17720 [Anabaena sp. FACHB-1237]|uniref:hypothetical protein n=1 Tax=Anabaena sp. FACHB-1237 TaxID=2692769 RepID=UPI0016802A59|nr:hypothetical protein [Anabaena sp. FACHB-1237]MBD2139359.1 hypothetical protein [Anabaena sp. FACHB-1237]
MPSTTPSATLGFRTHPADKATYIVYGKWKKDHKEPGESQGNFLPSADSVFTTYKEWRNYYNDVILNPLISVAPTPVRHNITKQELQQGLKLRNDSLKKSINSWLQSSPLFIDNIETRMLAYFEQNDSILVRVETDDPRLIKYMRLDMWKFFDKFKNAEIVYNTI